MDEVRTAVKHLISTNEITKQAYSKFTVFTVKNYDAYQFVPSNFPSKSQAIPEQFPTIEKGKKAKKKEKNWTNQFQQNEYDFGQLEREIVSNLKGDNHGEN